MHQSNCLKYKGQAIDFPPWNQGPKIPFTQGCPANGSHSQCNAHRAPEIDAVAALFMRPYLAVYDVCIDLNATEHK